MAVIPCDVAGMEMMIGSLDPWDKILNIPCWMPFMWETVLSYGSIYNADVLGRIGQAKWMLEEKYVRKTEF